jgi:O-antigen ligase
MIKEPLVLAILFLCTVLTLGILWRKTTLVGVSKMEKVFCLPGFIPFLSLLNKDRLIGDHTDDLLGKHKQR